jgi:uncharacterized damage-inducible protein DinB
MTEVQRIHDQLRRAFYGDAWHGPSVMEVLANVTASQAAAWPIAHAHSIWEITLHISAWTDAVIRRMQGERVELTTEQDWPPVHNATEASWHETLAELKRRQEVIEKTLSGLADSRLDDPVPGKDYTVYFLVHGLIQHDLYHAGQIAVLKKR